ncbi:MAG TPA: c-type cytochrome [Sphingomicrobium sp.]|nr:c-type cytochrome [Sphingomicrobium sp.]
MQKIVMLLVLAGLTGCGTQSEEGADPQAEVKPAALTYEGGDYKDHAAKLAHGKRLATVLVCTGCHGANLQGTNVSADDPDYGDMNAPNITLLLAGYSDAELDQLIRHGKPRDGREFWFMPTEAYQFLSDADYDALVAYLRTLKPEGKQLPPIRRGKGFNEEVAKGLFGNSQQQIQKFRSRQPVDLGQQHGWGRYLAQTTCTMCHNNELQGWAEFTPDLNVAGVFTPAELETLLTTGKGKSKPDLGLMSKVARDHFSHFTPRERQAVIAYVQARANRPQPAQ